MGKSSKSSSTKIEGSPSSEKRKAEDELEMVNPITRHNIAKTKKKIASIKQEMDSLKVNVGSLKEDVSSLIATLISVKSKLDLLPTKEDLLAFFASFKEPAKIPASVKNNVIPVKKNKDQKKTDGGEEPAQKRAKADTSTPKKESSSNVSSKESDVVEKETIKRTLRPCSSSNVSSKESDVVEKETLQRMLCPCSSCNRHEKTAEVGERVLFVQKEGRIRYDSGTIFVKGYDSSLCEDEIASAVLEHFSPCGMIERIYFKTDDTGAAILRHVFIEMIEGTEDALKLNGSDMGGCKLEVHNAKHREEYYINRERSGPYIPPNYRLHFLLNRHNYQSEKPPLYGIVSSSKINK